MTCSVGVRPRFRTVHCLPRMPTRTCRRKILGPCEEVMVLNKIYACCRHPARICQECFQSDDDFIEHIEWRIAYDC